MIYFIRQVGGGPVKIGCSYAPKTRLASYMACSPYPLEIVATYPGDRSAESRFHLMFDHLHSHLEWFHASPEIDAVIDEIVEGRFDADRLPRGTSGIISRRALKAHAARRRWHGERAA